MAGPEILPPTSLRDESDQLIREIEAIARQFDDAGLVEKAELGRCGAAKLGQLMGLLHLRVSALEDAGGA